MALSSSTSCGVYEKRIQCYEFYTKLDSSLQDIVVRATRAPTRSNHFGPRGPRHSRPRNKSWRATGLLQSSTRSPRSFRVSRVSQRRCSADLSQCQPPERHEACVDWHRQCLLSADRAHVFVQSAQDGGGRGWCKQAAWVERKRQTLCCSAQNTVVSTRH